VTTDGVAIPLKDPNVRNWSLRATAQCDSEGEAISSSDQSWTVPETSAVLAGAVLEGGRWFAVQTHARHEKAVVQRLMDRGVTAFLPLFKQVHRWSDRRKTIEKPLFGCYVFVRIVPRGDERLRVLLVDGVLKFVGAAGQGLPIPDEQISAIRALVEEQLPYYSHPFLKVGQRVRIRGGALDGVEGILMSRSGESSLVISLDAIQRSLALRVEGYDIEPI